MVADAIFEATTPIISAVGHENDFVISDFVADVRASTPSNAIELSTPNKNDLTMFIDSINDELNNKIKIILKNKSVELDNMKSLFTQHSFSKRFNFANQTIAQMKSNFNSKIKQFLQEEQKRVDFLKKNLLSNHPDKKMRVGFVQVTKDQRIVNLDDYKIDDNITLETTSYKFQCKILEKNKIN